MRKGATSLGLFLGLLGAVTAEAQQQPSFRTSIGDQIFNTARSLVTDDVDGDGNIDLVVAVRGDSGVSGGVSIFYGPMDDIGFFFQTVDVATDSVPAAVVVADFNHDGHKDLATVDPNSQEIRVSLGTDQRDTFEDPVVTLPKACSGDGTACHIDDDCPVPQTCDLHGVGSPSNLAAAKLDNDDFVDLVVVSDDQSGQLAVLIGQGDGSFVGTSQSPFSTGQTTRAVKIADVNKDEALDLLTANRDSGNISVLLNLGGGNFSLPTNFPAGESPVDLTVGDFDNDHKVDVAVANYNTDMFSILRGDAAGAFGAPTGFDAGSFPDGIDSADFDVDGNLDVVVSNNLSNDVTVGFGNGTGGFSQLRSFLAGPGPLDVAVANLDAGSRPDIVVLNFIEVSSYSVLLGQPGRTFVTPETFRILDNAGPLTSGDINGDGLPDAIITSSSENDVAVLRATLNESMSVGTLDVGDATTAVLLADLDRDGHAELLVAGGSDSAGFLGVAHPAGVGGFGPLTRTVVGGSPSGIDVADFNGDGLLDVAVTEFRDDSVAVMLSKPDGTLGTPLHILLRAPGDPDELQPQAVAAADVDGDGFADLAIADFRENGGLSLVYGKGDGTFEAAISSPGGRRPLAVRVSDVDNDGLPDILTANEDSKGLILHHNISTGSPPWRTYEDNIEISVSGQPMDFVMRDLNNDGVLDAVLADFTDERIAIKRGGVTNKPYFSSTVQSCPQQSCLETGRNPRHVTAADFNGDGVYDLLSVNAFQAKNATLAFSDLETDLKRGDSNNDGQVSAADLISLTQALPQFNRMAVEELKRSGKIETLAYDADGDGLLSTVDATGTAARIFRATATSVALLAH